MVVRDIDVYASAGVGDVEFFFEGDLGQTIWWKDWSSGQTSAEHWTGRQVFEAGEAFTVRSTGNVDVTVSGYLLSAP